MNKQFHTICLCTLAALWLGSPASLAQTAQPLAGLQRLPAQASQGLSEKVYVHTDKTTYMAGDVLWFKVYSADALLLRPSTLSKIAYVEILDRANNPMAQAKIDLQQPGGGSLHLPLTLASGNYRLRGYTAWMKNQGPQSFFEQVVTIINPLKNLEAAKTAPTPAYSAQFFPEGGDMVQGLESRLAFQLTDRTGHGIEGSGVVVSSAGDTLTTFYTHKFGIGSFTLRPQAGQTYKALVSPQGGEPFTQALPKAVEHGYTMRVAAETPGTLQVTVQSNEPSQQGGLVYLLTHTRGVARGTSKAALVNGTARFTVDQNALGDGVSQFTVFDAGGQAVSERLYFKHPTGGLTLSARSDQEQYPIRSKVALTVQATGTGQQAIPAGLSLSVYRLDSLQGAPAADIQSYLWLTSELHGQVESPAYYLSAASPEVEEATDLLMLTHGWRRLQPKEAPAPPATPLYPLEYHGQLITVRVLDTRTGTPAIGVPVFLSVPGLHFHFFSGNTDSTGLVHFDVTEVYGASELVLQTNTPKESFYRCEVLTPFATQYTTDSLPPFRLPAGPRLLEAYSIAMQAQNVYHADSLRRFALPPLRDTLPFYGKANYSYTLDEYTRFVTMEEVLREYVREINVSMRGGKLYLHMLDEDRHQFYEDNVLVLVDGVALVDKNKIFDYDPHKVRQLDIVPKGYLLGPNYYKGVASFLTYGGDLKGFALDPRVLMVNYEGLQLQREFYAPVYETAAQQASRIPDLRTTLLWKPDITTNAQGTSALSFYTSDNKGHYIGVLQGLDSEGHPASTTFTFEVQ